MCLKLAELNQLAARYEGVATQPLSELAVAKPTEPVVKITRDDYLSLYKIVAWVMGDQSRAAMAYELQRMYENVQAHNELLKEIAYMLDAYEDGSGLDDTAIKKLKAQEAKDKLKAAQRYAQGLTETVVHLRDMVETVLLETGGRHD